MRCCLCCFRRSELGAGGPVCLLGPYAAPVRGRGALPAITEATRRGENDEVDALGERLHAHGHGTLAGVTLMNCIDVFWVYFVRKTRSSKWVGAASRPQHASRKARR